MNRLAELVERGGWVMPMILGLAFVLYWRCFALLLGLAATHRRALRDANALASRPEVVRLLQADAMDTFRRQRALLGSMIAAAPLLGLLGTVSGMERTFVGLSARAGEKSMEALAGGISEVLVATQSGLAVAIPAMLFVYVAHRLVVRQVADLNRIARSREAAA